MIYVLRYEFVSVSINDNDNDSQNICLAFTK